jgi:hypothetical protein
VAPHPALVDNDQWQTGYLSGDKLGELKFWLGEKAVSAPAPQAAHTVSSAAEPAPAAKARPASQARKTPARAKPAEKAPPKKKTAPKKK